jgi:hypothetical protein
LLPYVLHKWIYIYTCLLAKATIANLCSTRHKLMDFAERVLFFEQYLNIPIISSWVLLMMWSWLEVLHQKHIYCCIFLLIFITLIAKLTQIVFCTIHHLFTGYSDNYKFIFLLDITYLPPIISWSNSRWAMFSTYILLDNLWQSFPKKKFPRKFMHLDRNSFLPRWR